MKLYKLIFVANAFLLLISIYLTNKGVAIGKIPLEFRGKSLSVDIPDWISYCIYFGIPILTTWCETKSFRKLDPTEIKSEAINSIESASSTFLPTFFAYVFVGLSISTIPSLLFIYCAVTLLCFCAEIYLYNPIFHILGYRFYFVTIGSHRVLIMTRKEIKLRESIKFERLGQINDFTYIDIEK